VKDVFWLEELGMPECLWVYEAVNWAVLERARYFLRKRHRVSTQTMWRRFSAPVLYQQYGVHQLRRRNPMPTLCAVM
jgi:hypothetical protein